MRGPAPGGPGLPQCPALAAALFGALRYAQVAYGVGTSRCSRVCVLREGTHGDWRRVLQWGAECEPSLEAPPSERPSSSLDTPASSQRDAAPACIPAALRLFSAEKSTPRGRAQPWRLLVVTADDDVASLPRWVEQATAVDGGGTRHRVSLRVVRVAQDGDGPTKPQVSCKVMQGGGTLAVSIQSARDGAAVASALLDAAKEDLCLAALEVAGIPNTGGTTAVLLVPRSVCVADAKISGPIQLRLVDTPANAPQLATAAAVAPAALLSPRGAPARALSTHIFESKLALLASSGGSGATPVWGLSMQSPGVDPGARARLCAHRLHPKGAWLNKRLWPSISTTAAGQAKRQVERQRTPRVEREALMLVRAAEVCTVRPGAGIEADRRLLSRLTWLGSNTDGVCAGRRHPRLRALWNPIEALLREYPAYPRSQIPDLIKRLRCISEPEKLFPLLDTPQVRVGARGAAAVRARARAAAAAAEALIELAEAVRALSVGGAPGGLAAAIVAVLHTSGVRARRLGQSAEATDIRDASTLAAHKAQLTPPEDESILRAWARLDAAAAGKTDAEEASPAASRARKRGGMRPSSSRKRRKPDSGEAENGARRSKRPAQRQSW